MTYPLFPLPALPPLKLPALPQVLASAYSPWFPMDRTPWEPGMYQVKFQSNVNVNGVYDPDVRFEYSPLLGWLEFGNAKPLAWRGLAEPAK